MPLFTPDAGNPSQLLTPRLPFYTTAWGAAYLADAREILSELPSDSVDLIVTSPPYALHFKKEYGNVDKSDYVEWFLGFAREMLRVLKEQGSFVLNIGGGSNRASPTPPLYRFNVLVRVVAEIESP